MAKPQNVFITGATAGIGEALAREYARLGASVFLTGRREERLQALAAELRAGGTRADYAVMDVCVTASVEAAVHKALGAWGPIDVLIANAGFGVVGNVENLVLEDYQRQFETNIYGVIRCVQAALPSLKLSRGRIAVIGSVNGYVALPGNSPYAMSKHAVRALSDSLWHELRPYGIHVTHISPGFISTEIRRVDNLGEFRKQTQDPIPSWLCGTPRHAARVIRRAISGRKREKSITGHGWLVIRLVRHFPALTHHLIRILKISARGEP